MNRPATHPDYAKLPEAIKSQVTEREYSWMTEVDRARLMDDFTMPEAVED